MKSGAIPAINDTMERGTRSPLWVLVVLLSIGACEKGEKKSPEPQQPAKPLQSFGTAPPTVTLLEEGREPRRTLAYAPSGGRRKAKLSWTLSQPGMPQASMNMKLTVDWRSPAASTGAWQFAVEKAEPGAMPPDASEEEQQVIKSVYAMFAQVKGRVEASGSGHFQFHQTGGVPTQPSLLWLLHALVVPFPGEAIGEGARWKVSQQLTQRGLEGKSVRHYQLTRLADETVGVRVEGTTEWRPGTASKSSQIGLGSVSETLEGELTTDLTDPLPASGRLTLAQEIVMKLPPSGPGSAAAEDGSEHTMRTKILLELGGAR